MFSSNFISGTVPKFTSCTTCATSPLSFIAPESALCSELINLSKVDFPHPLAPIKTQKSPRSKYRLISSITGLKIPENDFVTFVILIINHSTISILEGMVMPNSIASFLLITP